MTLEFVPTSVSTHTAHISRCTTSSSQSYPFAVTDITCQQLLDHMRESMVYSEADLGPFQKRLAELRQIVQNDAANHPPAMIELLERKLGQCGTYLRRLSFITCSASAISMDTHVPPTPYFLPIHV
jgi:hypothetical protein